MLKVHPQMQYRKLGNSGLIVSSIAFGNASNQTLSYQQNKQIVKVCLQSGINFFDTSQVYWNGEAESCLGTIFKDLNVNRQQIVIATKILTASNPSINSTMNINQKHIKQSLKQSLRRLNMDYVDVIYSHIYDQNTSIEQVCKAFNDVIEDGYAFYWAVSNWPADRIFKAIQVCQTHNLHKPICGQIHYNMIIRHKAEKDYKKLLEKYNFEIVTYNTLLGGYLTGKYLNQDLKTGRFNTDIPEKKIDKSFWKNFYYDYIDFEGLDEKLVSLKQIAQKQLGCSLIHLTIIWCIKYRYVSSAILGAKTPQQIADIIQSLKYVQKFTPQIQCKINKILNTHPEPQDQFKSFSKQKSLRNIQQ